MIDNPQIVYIHRCNIEENHILTIGKVKNRSFLHSLKIARNVHFEYDYPSAPKINGHEIKLKASSHKKII